jgi:23S rRNA (adenine2503-C2)-methyltransferase
LLLKDHTTEELSSLAEGIGATARVARRLQALAMKRRVDTLPHELPGVARRVWERVLAETRVPHLAVLERAVSAYDGFAKYLFKGDGEAPFEAVRIPLLHRPGDEKYIVCVSSQVGCAAKCAFCETGKLGFKRNLETWEIVDQVVKIQSDSDLPVRGVVFMGMGEPFLNYARVMRAAKIMSDPSGLAIDAKAISISTVGVTPMIRRFTAEGHPHRLIVSVHTSLAAQRDELVPMNKIHPLPGVIEALREHQAVTGKRVLLAWTMMAGVNMSREHVLELARLTDGMRILLDLIPVNDPTGRFRPPTAAEEAVFFDMLRADLGCPIVRRYSGGKDVHGACGMLAGLALQNQPAVTPG